MKDHSAGSEVAGSSNALNGAWTAVATGLSHEPALLFGFGVVMVLAVVGQVMGGNLLPAGWLIVGVYGASMLGWALTRRRPADDDAHEIGNAGPRATQSGAHPAVPVRPAAELTRSSGIKISESFNEDDPDCSSANAGIRIDQCTKSKISKSFNKGTRNYPGSSGA